MSVPSLKASIDPSCIVPPGQLPCANWTALDGASLRTMPRRNGLLASGRRSAIGTMLLALAVWLTLPCASLAADALRGASLFALPAGPGLLSCADCHSDNPIENNFGNIWSGRNAAALIQRAVQNNTGGMGVFLNLYDATDLADIAAYLGNAPNSLTFAPTAPGAISPALRITISSSLKVGIEAMRLTVEGEFVLIDTDCGTSLPRFSSCAVNLAFRPGTEGRQAGALVFEHSGTPTPLRLPLMGEGQAPARAVATLTPNRVEFPAGNGTRRNVVLSNESAEPLRIQQVRATPPSFVVIGGSCVVGLVLVTGEHCLIALRVNGPAEAEVHGTLTVDHNGLDGHSTVLLQASPTAGTGAELRADRVAMGFGAHAAGTGSAPQVLTLTNGGSAELTWREILSSDTAFVIDSSSCTAGALAPQQRCQLAVSFAGARPGPVSAELRMVGHDGLRKWRIPMSGRMGDGVLRTAPQRLAWQAQVGQRVTQDLMLVNDADKPVNVSAPVFVGAQAGDFALAGGTCDGQGNLRAGASCTLTVAYLPTQAGPSSARLQLADLSVSLAGQAFTAPPISLWLDASAIDFGEQAIGSAAVARRVTVVNRGAAALSWRALTLVGSHAADFVTTGGCRIDQPLMPHASCQIEIAFVPGGAGQRMVTAVLWPQGAATPALLTIKGLGVQTTKAALVADVLALDFGTQPQSVPLPTRRVQLLNSGTAELAAPMLHINGPFRIVAASQACTAALAPGQACVVDVALAADGVGAAGGALTVQSSGTAPLVLMLTGRRSNMASALTWIAPEDVPAPMSTPVGSVSSLNSWTLFNRGNAPTAPLRWTLDGPAAEDFSVDPSSTCSTGTVLEPGARCALRASFSPSAGGLRTARLLLRDDNSAGALSLQGQGLAPALAMLRAQPDVVPFQARVGAATPPQALVLSNDGASAAAMAVPGSTSPAFTSSADARGPCGAAVLDLLPGETCDFDIAWAGSPAGLPGGSFVAGSADAMSSATVALVVIEDPAQRSNVGAGGGALTIGELLALAIVLAMLWRTRTESDHA